LFQDLENIRAQLKDTFISWIMRTSLNALQKLSLAHLSENINCEQTLELR